MADTHRRHFVYRLSAGIRRHDDGAQYSVHSDVNWNHPSRFGIYFPEVRHQISRGETALELVVRRGQFLYAFHPGPGARCAQDWSDPHRWWSCCERFLCRVAYTVCVRMWSVRARALCFSRGDLSYCRPQHREPCAKRFSLASALLRRRACPHRIRCFHHFETWRARDVSRPDTMVGAAAHWDDARLRDRSTGQPLAAQVCGGAIRRDCRSDVDPYWLELGAISKADYARRHHL